MKLTFPFIQLPVAFDAARLLAEIEALGESAWRPHPQGYAGNWGLPLLAVNGDPDDDRTAGPMQPTPYLERCPYTIRVLSSLGAVWGRTRLMRLDGNAEVTAHVDTNYYWRERVRVHVPVLTRPDVRFECDDQHVNMAAGECWIFDTWRMHRVLNPAETRRIHLVADTVGSEAFWRLVAQGRRHDQQPPGWSPQRVPYAQGDLSELAVERVNRAEVLSPWEIKDTLGFIFSEAVPHPALGELHGIAMNFVNHWRALWAQHGESEAGKPAFRAEAQRFWQALQPYREQVALRNGLELTKVISSLVLVPSVKADAQAEAAEPRERDVVPASAAAPARMPSPPGPRAGERDPVFEQPVFVVCAPRSGSTMLFETLSQAPGLYTLGRENYAVLEGIAALHPRQRGFDSNRLDAGDATPEVVAELRQRYFAELRDRDGRPPSAAPLRMMDKTPKNALRVPFLAKVFPEARFVYLHRDPRQVLSSMIEAWESGKFGTYPGLPDWPGLPWSLLLVPGWRELRGKPLHEIVAAQWAATIGTLVADLEALPRERRSVLRYDELLRDPQAALAALCARHGLGWDRDLSAGLPLSRNTVTLPDPEKWRRHAAQIEAVWPALAGIAQRAEDLAGAA